MVQSPHDGRQYLGSRVVCRPTVAVFDEAHVGSSCHLRRLLPLLLLTAQNCPIRPHSLISEFSLSWENSRAAHAWHYQDELIVPRVERPSACLAVEGGQNVIHNCPLVEEADKLCHRLHVQWMSISVVNMVDANSKVGRDQPNHGGEKSEFTERKRKVSGTS